MIPENKKQYMNHSIKSPLFIHLPETDSTNRLLHSLNEAEDLPSGSIILADFQTAGHGQAGNAWESEAGKNLTFSILFRPADVPAGRSFVISEMASLSVKYTLDEYLPDITVKWPNDVYCKDRKITGILIENTVVQSKISYSVIGIGINVNQTAFSGNAPNPVSMAQVTGRSYDRTDLMEDFRQQFARQSARVNNLCFDPIHRDYLQSVYRKGGYYRYADKDGPFEAKIDDIEPSGHLILARTDGSRSRYAFKEVTCISYHDPDETEP
jgi:BirA family biotin operon repressor/biotin-[acetyl-CoA-carboxylase] ligase